MERVTLFSKLRKEDLKNVSLPEGISQSNVANGLYIVFGIAGGISLIVVAYGALKYVLSQGNPQETSKAKNTIIDGLIGLVVIISAASITSFVINFLR